MTQNKKRITRLALLALLPSAALSGFHGIAAADDDGTYTGDGLSELTIVAGAASGYRDRGLSLLGAEDIAANLYLGYQDKSGLFGSVFVSSIGSFGDAVQLDAVGGFGWASGGFDLEVYGAVRNYWGDDFTLPQGRESFYDVGFNASRDFGLVYWKAGVNYAPNGRWSAVNGDSIYVQNDIEIPIPTIPELTLTTHVGLDLLSSASDRFDWSAGLSYFVGPIELTGAYVRAEQISGSGDTSEVIFGVNFYF